MLQLFGNSEIQGKVDTTKMNSGDDVFSIRNHICLSKQT